ncbi:MAG: Mrp/NBP35 family ATP-binding protein [Acidobacteria bacterium]|nr:Mrp/NBP35 family ATP-binding protein [Acidobacteriota bacterium]
MATEQQILETLNRFTAPGSTTGLVDGGAVRNVEVDGSSIRVALAFPAGPPGPIDGLRTALTQALTNLDEIDSADVQIQTMLSTISTAPTQVQAPEPPSWGEKITGIKNVIAVASGKGGVGKSTVSANLALALAQADFAVGLLDADIYGPSQQMMTGAKGEPRGTADGRILPIMAPGGVTVMSLGFIVDPDQPVIWRGPLLMKALEQLIVDVEWGDLDYLIVDLPPGTGDITLSLCQNVNLAGAIIVTTPQDVALIDARKGLAMFQKLDVEVLGLIENMAAYTCPSCGNIDHIFGSGGGRRTAETLGIPFLGDVPLDPSIVVGGDAGTPVVSDRPDSPAAKAFIQLAKTIAGERSEE